jgi:TetR/AcrR family transcriptional regulator, multidrug resistance operon repressor
MDKKQEILKVFLELIIKNGFHATPMSLVAKTSKISIGTIYHYFKSKEDLINELYSILKEKFGSNLKLRDNPNLCPKDRFFLNCRNVFMYYVENSSDFLFFEQYDNSPFISKKTKEENIKHYEFLWNFLDQGVSSGFLRKMPVLLIMELTYGNLRSIIKMHLFGDLIITEDLLNDSIQSAWDAIRIN